MALARSNGNSFSLSNGDSFAASGSMLPQVLQTETMLFRLMSTLQEDPMNR